MFDSCSEVPKELIDALVEGPRNIFIILRSSTIVNSHNGEEEMREPMRSEEGQSLGRNSVELVNGECFE